MAKKQIKTITDTILFFTIQLHMKKYEGTYVIKGVEKKNTTRNRYPMQLKKVKIRCSFLNQVHISTGVGLNTLNPIHGTYGREVPLSVSLLFLIFVYPIMLSSLLGTWTGKGECSTINYNKATQKIVLMGSKIYRIL